MRGAAQVCHFTFNQFKSNSIFIPPFFAGGTRRVRCLALSQRLPTTPYTQPINFLYLFFIVYDHDAHFIESLILIIFPFKRKKMSLYIKKHFYVNKTLKNSEKKILSNRQ